MADDGSLPDDSEWLRKGLLRDDFEAGPTPTPKRREFPWGGGKLYKTPVWPGAETKADEPDTEPS